MFNWGLKRKKPYMEATIHTLKCARCGNPAYAQWNICADNNYFRPICKACDIALNEIVLKWFKHPNTKVLMKEYKRSKDV